MNYTEYSTITSLLADYDNYVAKMNNKGLKPVSAISYAFGNVQ